MPRKPLPRFLIYQPNQKEFHICFEVGDKYLRWSSFYPPTLDVRFGREVKRIEDLPLKKLPRKPIYDEGSYTVTKSDDKDTAMRKLAEGALGKSFSFTLDGKKLKGRFSLKRTTGGAEIRKYKDKYAQEEDLLSGDLSRTISTMIPDYDEKKFKLETPSKKKQTEVEEPEEEDEEITADKTIGNRNYHFSFYTSTDNPDICLIADDEGQVLLLQRVDDNWILLQPVSRTVMKKEQEFIDHAKALYEAEGR